MFSPCLLCWFCTQCNPDPSGGGTQESHLAGSGLTSPGKGEGVAVDHWRWLGKTPVSWWKLCGNIHHIITDVEHNMCQYKSMPLTRASHWKSHLRSSIKHGNTLWSSTMTVAYQPLYRGFSHDLGISQPAMFACRRIYIYYCFFYYWVRQGHGICPSPCIVAAVLKRMSVKTRYPKSTG